MLLLLKLLGGGGLRRVQYETVVDNGQLGEAILFEAHETRQRRCLLAGAAHAVDDMPFLLFADKENIEDLELLIEIKSY